MVLLKLHAASNVLLCRCQIQLIQSLIGVVVVIDGVSEIEGDIIHQKPKRNKYAGKLTI